MSNQDKRVIEEFGDEWTKFNHLSLDKKQLKDSFDQYFQIFPWNLLPKDPVGFDMGCGSGRWAQYVAPKVKTLNCIEPSNAINVAKKVLSDFDNIKFFNETTDNCSLNSNSQDFGYCLGVLHHIPNTQKALEDCVRLLKSDAPLLLYLYYSFDNKPKWYEVLWKLSDFLRKYISSSPKPVKNFSCILIAYLIYLPLAKSALMLEKLGFNVSNFPLSDYRYKPFYQYKNDALDRFGTRLEQRFSQSEITKMLLRAGCRDVKFSQNTPFWCCIAFKN
jgi:ubiquinone/menaquinone biosynthesis C-methylase UbiE